MQSRMRSDGIGTFEEMLEAMSESSDPLKLRPYHMIIFAKNRTPLDSNGWLVVEYSCGKIRIGDQGIKMKTMVVAFNLVF